MTAWGYYPFAVFVSEGLLSAAVRGNAHSIGFLPQTKPSEIYKKRCKVEELDWEKIKALLEEEPEHDDDGNIIIPGIKRIFFCEYSVLSRKSSEEDIRLISAMTEKLLFALQKEVSDKSVGLYEIALMCNEMMIKHRGQISVCVSEECDLSFVEMKADSFSFNAEALRLFAASPDIDIDIFHINGRIEIYIDICGHKRG